MNLFENATQFMRNCDDAKGWDACKDLVADNATFTTQSEPLVEVKTVQAYVEWIDGLSNITMPGCSYKVNTSAFDEANKTAIFFSTFTGTHTGEGGPVEPTNKTTNSDYVYVVKMNDNGKVDSMTKIWNAPWCMRELGWM